jgi:hypothetical protein
MKQNTLRVKLKQLISNDQIQNKFNYSVQRIGGKTKAKRISMGKTFSDSIPRSDRSPLFEIYAIANTHTTNRVPETEESMAEGL